MKKLFTALLLTSAALMFACEDPSEEAFAEIDAPAIIEDLDLSTEEVIKSETRSELELDSD